MRKLKEGEVMRYSEVVNFGDGEFMPVEELHEAIDYAANGIHDSYRETSEIVFSVEDGCVTINVAYIRPETDREKSRRMAAEYKDRQENKMRDYRTLKQLITDNPELASRILGNIPATDKSGTRYDRVWGNLPATNKGESQNG